MTDICDFGFADDYAFVRHMIEQGRSGGRARLELFCKFSSRRNINSLLLLQKV